MTNVRQRKRGAIEAAGGLLWREAPSGKEIAVLHRPRYDDWTLPKGKLHEDESWQDAAVREVREETQCEVVLGQFIGCSSYRSSGLPKVVLFWHMDLASERLFEPNPEVDGLLWLETEKAMERLSHGNDRELLKKGYYVARSAALLRGFDQDAAQWLAAIAADCGHRFAEIILQEARQQFAWLIPHIPYIGGDSNHLTQSLVKSARCLALFRAMNARGKSAEETGRVLYDATVAREGAASSEVSEKLPLTEEQLMERRRRRAARSQRRQYAEDWLYDFVEGDGEAFDYGYDMHACATHRFYLAQHAIPFLLFYCFLDYAESKLGGLGLSRTMTLAEGHSKCNHRFKKGRQSEPTWPPPFLASRS